MTATPDSIAIEMYLDGANWTDVSGDVLAGSISVKYGIMGNGPIDRVAGSGQMTFQLDNSEYNSAGLLGYYTPGHINCRAGFTVGLAVRLAITYDGGTYYKFFGKVPPDGIEVEPGIFSGRRVKVTALDWMEQAAIHTLYLPTLDSNKYMGQIVQLVIDNMPIAPLDTDLAGTLSRGETSFEDVFDTVRSNTTALAEINKAVQSEIGYCYVTRDKTGGELLRTESHFARASILPKTIDYPTEAASIILDESGESLLDETGADLLIDGESFLAQLNTPVYGNPENYITLDDENGDSLLDETESALYTDSYEVVDYFAPPVSMKTNYGKYSYNQIRYTVYPRYTDATATTVLFALNYPLQLAARETRTNILGRFRDPTGGAARVSGKDMVTPVATTDYLMFQNSNGTGTNLTANLVVTAYYGAEGVNYTLQNTGVTDGYVTKLQARGKGVYIYDPVTQLVEDTALEEMNGTRTLALDWKYRKDVAEAALLANVHLALLKNPYMFVDSVTFFANYDAYLLIMWLELDLGDKFSLYEGVSGVSADYFINGIDFTVLAGNVTRVTWVITRSVINTTSGFWKLGDPIYGILGATTILGY